MFEAAVKDKRHEGWKLRELRWSIKPSINLYDLYRATKIQVSVLSGIENGNLVPSDDQLRKLERTIRNLIDERLRSGQAVVRTTIPSRKRSDGVRQGD